MEYDEIKVKYEYIQEENMKTVNKIWRLNKREITSWKENYLRLMIKNEQRNNRFKILHREFQKMH
jgi:hypothetical protein